MAKLFSTDGGAYRPPVRLQEALAGVSRVVITAHVDPDPDGLGCALGLFHILRREGWAATPVCVGRLPSFAESLPGNEHLVEWPARWAPFEEPARLMGPGDALVVVDTPSLARMGSFAQLHESVFPKARVINIDHHITNEQYGTFNLVDTTASASAEVVCDILEASGMSLDAAAAQCLMAALLADTQGFRTESTSPRSLLLAHRLWEAGAPVYPLARVVFAGRSLSGFRLWGAALARLQTESRIVWTTVTDEMVHQAGAHMEETDGLVDFLLACRDVDVAILLKQQGDAETKVSVRTLPEIDATRIVGVFGGGGHQRAAGCTISCHPEEAVQVLLPLARAELGGRRG